MNYPILTCAVLTYKRPWYAVMTIMSLRDNLRYAGPVQFVIADEGSPDWQLALYRELLKDCHYEIVTQTNVAGMLNAAAAHSGEVWLTVLDDFTLEVRMDITADVEFLLAQTDVGHLRYGRMSHWSTAHSKVFAELRQSRDFIYYWVLDKARSTEPYMWTIGFGLTHRRMWEAYGPLPGMEPHQPGNVELAMNDIFRSRPGPTTAVPMRIGHDADMWMRVQEPIRHWGYVRTDEYANAWGGGAARWGAI